ncbi:HNH endonuclease family protein [Nocardioides bruguierae]|uniref:HNH endonuclease family protein n=1 Tax=Nocardioides bruguierae TaxID=2945102 RepID=A0A9X2D6E6_9ACTN|nr:HNH endonuclease family protein [Nocardioides bruguierae]MCM0620115.1 HNH endonuclease family protein [Nocardioides bruguierae]
MHRPRPGTPIQRPLLSLAGLAGLAVALVVGIMLIAGSPATAAAGQTYSAPLSRAVADLPVAAEHATGYDRDLFEHWTDADGDGCDTRREVLISEADDPVTVGAGCSLSGGRWYSYYDGVSWYDPSDVDIDHMVPLAEAWGSGAWSWSDATREAYANDLGDYRTLVGVTDNVNQSKSDRDVAEWLPAQQQCRYLREWTAVKHRWGLSVDATEKAAMTDLASTCSDLTITVTLAR